MDPALSILSGGVVGLALGLTGGGGSVLALPLLVYVLSVAPHDATVISLATVGIAALVGAIHRFRTHQVDVRVGLLYGASGAVCAPLGLRIAENLSERALLLSFAALMLGLAIKMWPWRLRRAQTQDRAQRSSLARPRFAVLLVIATGALTGVLAGLFGIGGGFIIVSSLVLVLRMEIHRAIATSLFVIAIIATSGVSMRLIHGEPMDLGSALPFIVGTVLCMLLAGVVAKQLRGPTLHRVFAGSVFAAAVALAVKWFDSVGPY